MTSTNNTSAVLNTSAAFDAPKVALTAAISLSTISRYGMSTVALVQEALTIHRDTCMGLFLEEMQQGSYRNAYAYYSSFEDLNTVLDELLTELTKVAENNYLAEQYAHNPKGYRPAETSNDNRESRYQAWLKRVLPVGEPGQSEAPKESVNKYGLTPSDGTFLLDMRDAGATDQEITRLNELIIKRNTMATSAEQ